MSQPIDILLASIVYYAIQVVRELFVLRTANERSLARHHPEIVRTYRERLSKMHCVEIDEHEVIESLGRVVSSGQIRIYRQRET
jgi:hypothetical protein